MKPNPPMYETLRDFYKWLMLDCCMIKDKSGTPIPLHPTAGQLLFLKALLKQAKAEKPLRVIVLKARQVGLSTMCLALFSYLCMKKENMGALTVMHNAADGAEMFQAAHYMSEQSGFRSDSRTNRIQYTSGSQYRVATASGKWTASGSTLAYVHYSEAAKYPIEEGLKNIESITNTMPTTPESIIIFESTSIGRDPCFWPKWELSQEKDSIYEGVFIPWYLDSEYVLDTEPLEHTIEEKVLVQTAKRHKIKLNDNALAWRRYKISEAVTPESFMRDYPSTPAEAIVSSSGLVYPEMSLCLIDEMPEGHENWDRIGGIDPAHDPDSTAIVTGKYYDRILYIYDVYRDKGRLIKDHAKYMCNHCTYYIDHSASTFAAELRSKFTRTNGIKIVKVSHKRTGPENLSVPGEIEAVKKLMKEGRLKILRSCSEILIEESEGYVYKANENYPDKSKRSSSGSHFDALDSLRYLVLGLKSFENPTEVFPASARPSKRLIY